MKRIFTLIAAIVGLSACNNPIDNPDPINPITPDKDWITFSPSANLSPVIAAEGGSVEVSFSAYGNWQLAANQQRVAEWLTVSPSSGSKGDNTITITADANGTYDERNATVKLTCGTETKSIVVTQKQKDAITVSKSKFEISAMGETISVEVKSNIEYSYKIEDDAKSWVAEIGTKAMAAKTLSFRISENEDNAKREGTITFSSGDIKETIKIYQEGAKPTIVLTKSEYAVAAGGETIKVEVKSNVDVSYSIASGIDWIKESATKAMSTSTFYFQIAANSSYESRTAEIFFKNEANGLSEKVIITQVPKNALVIAKNSYNIDNKGGNIEIEVSHNVDFDIDIADSWVSQISTKSYTTDKLVFTVAENTTTDNRETKITFTSKDKTISQDVIIYQSQSNALILSEKEKAISADGGTFTIEINHNIDFDVVIPEIDWITSVETKAISTSTKSFSVFKNETYDARSAEIIFKSKDGSLSDKVIVTQMQKGAIIVAKDLYEFDRSGGELTVEVNHSVEFDVEISDGWISEVSTKAMSTTAMIFSIANNDSGKKREGHITFKSKDESISQCITVKQGIITTIVTSKKNLIFYPEGGSEKIEINPLVKFTYDIDEGSGPNWIQSSSIQEPTINLKIGTNDSSDERLGYVYVTDIESGKVDTVKIVQRAFDVYIIEDEYSCSYKGGSLTIDFQTNVPYSVELKDSPDWISIVSTKALSPSVISFNCNKNTSTSSRIAIVQFFNSYGECTKEIAIRQYSSHYEGDYIVDSEEDALFLNQCAFTAIDGDLTIKDIPSAASMNNIIEEISGSLYLYCQYPKGMSNFDGLYGLKHVVGDVIIKGDTWKLMSTEGLNNLNKIDGSLNIHGQYDKNAFKGLIGLTSIGRNLTISASSSYRITVPFTGLNNLLSVGGDISISNADDLTGLELTKVNNLTLSNVNSFTGLSRLHEISGNLEITGDSTADSFAGFDNLEIIGGNFYISAGPAKGNVFSNISSFSGFSKLRQIGGNFEIYSYVYTDGSAFPNLTSLDGFESLTKVNGNFLLHSRMQERNKDNGGTGEIYIFPKLLEINIPTLQEIGGNLEITNTTMAAQYRGGGKYCYGIDYKNVTFNNLKKIGGNFVCSDIAEDSYWSGNNAYKLCKAPPKLESLAGLSANMAFSSINDGFLSLTEIDNLTLTKENCLGFPAIETIKKGLEITLFDDPGEEFKMDKLKIIGGDLSIYLSRYNHYELSIMQSLETIGGSFNLELSTMQDQFVNRITGFTNLSSVKSISVSNFTKVDDFRVFVNAVKNGSSWICSGCAFNPTQTQMRNGIYKED